MRRSNALFKSTLLIFACTLGAAALSAPPSKADVPPRFYSGGMDIKGIQSYCEGELNAAKAGLNTLLAVQGSRTVGNTLDVYNDLMTRLHNAGNASSLMESVHPEEAFRTACEKLTQEADRLETEISLNRKVYDALAAVDSAKLDAKGKYFLDRTLKSFKRSGVDRDDATRERIGKLNDRLTELSQAFGRNIRNDRRTFQVKPEELKGLPEDFIKAHAPSADGTVKLTIENPDYVPVVTYAQSDSVRKRMRHERLNRAYPANIAVLDEMLKVRHELATTLGYPHWAAYIIDDKMIGSSDKASEFLGRLSTLVKSAAADEYKVYLKRKQEDTPDATAVQQWESTYYRELIRKRDYNFDSQSVRPYFPFASVKQGLMDTMQKLFGVKFVRDEKAAVWHPTVEAYDLLDKGKLIGRFFLDLHPREGKYDHAAQFGVRRGVAGKQLPEAALVCNFPGGKPNDPGLMEHSDVETFFHEFGHLLHTIFGGKARWEPLSGTGVERDFVEAPSQLLEEWIWDHSVLSTFAKHYQTGQPIPADLVSKMRRADTFGRAVDIAGQVVLANISLNVHNADPKSVNTDRVVEQSTRALSPFPPMPDVHMQTSFGHLDGYSAVYYTYQWSLVIAKDLFSGFNSAKMFDTKAPAKYRKVVLAPGGEKPARELVKDFLGREFSYDAYEAWVREGLSSPKP